MLVYRLDAKVTKGEYSPWKFNSNREFEIVQRSKFIDLSNMQKLSQSKNVLFSQLYRHFFNSEQYIQLWGRNA